MKYRITPRHIFHILSEVIIYGIILCIISTYLWIEYSELFIVVSSLLTLFYLLTVLFPVAVLFLNYYNLSKDDTIVLKENCIVLNNRIISISDILQIEIFGNKMYLNKQIGKLPHQDNFYYLVIILKDGSKLTLTSLLGRNIDRKIKERYPNLTYIENIRSFPLICNNSQIH